MTNPQARASVIWLVGEFAGTNNGDNIAADVLRILCRGFVNEEEDVRSQIVLLGAKVYLLYLNRVQQEQEQEAAPQPDALAEAETQDSQAWAAQDTNSNSTTDHANTSAQPQTSPSTQNHAIPKLWSYLLHLVRYDTSYPLRDRARTYRALLASPDNTDLASLVLLAPKPVPSAPSPSEDRRAYMLGSASLVIGPGGGGGAGSAGDEDEMGGGVGADGFTGYEGVPEWVEDGREPDSGLRDEEPGANATYVSPQGNSGVGLSASERLDAQMGTSGMSAAANGRPTSAARPAKEKTLDDWLEEEEGVKGDAEEDDDDEYDEEEDEEEDETDAESEDSEEEDEDDESEDDSEEDDHDERAGLMS